MGCGCVMMKMETRPTAYQITALSLNYNQDWKGRDLWNESRVTRQQKSDINTNDKLVIVTLWKTVDEIYGF